MLRQVKNSVKIFLPKPVFDFLVEFVKAVVFPVRFWVALRQNFPVWRKMDYAKTPLYLKVDSLVEWDTRLRSVQKEPETVSWLETYLRPGDVFFDVGANVGAYTLVAATLFPNQCRVFAFEPMAANYMRLVENVMKNGCGNSVVSLPLALSDRTELARFQLASFQTGAAEHAGLSGINQSVQNLFQDLLCIRLDAAVDLFSLPCPNHLKLDVDGAEQKILNGGENTLRRPELRSVLMEVDRKQANEDRLCGALISAGFKVEGVWEHEGKRIANMLFVRQ